MPPKAKTQQVIEVPAIEIQTLEIRLIGDSPLICHRWSERAKQGMRDKQSGKARQKKPPKDPQADYRDSLYPHRDGGYGFPCIAFKLAAIGACRYVDGLTMTAMRGAFHVVGEFAKIEGEPSAREDMVKIGMGTADLRYRGTLPDWSTTLVVRANARAITPAQLLNLFNIAGFAIGVGNWRPEKSGNFGMFHVEGVEG